MSVLSAPSSPYLRFWGGHSRRLRLQQPLKLPYVNKCDKNSMFTHPVFGSPHPKIADRATTPIRHRSITMGRPPTATTQPHSSIVCLDDRAMRPRWHPAGNAHGQNKWLHADLRQYAPIIANHVRVCAHTMIKAETASFPAAHISFPHMNYRDMRPTLAGSARDMNRCRRIHDQAPVRTGHVPWPNRFSPRLHSETRERAPNRMRIPAFRNPPSNHLARRLAAIIQIAPITATIAARKNR